MKFHFGHKISFLKSRFVKLRLYCNRSPNVKMFSEEWWNGSVWKWIWNYWTALTDGTNTVSCSGLGCDDSGLYWRRGGGGNHPFNTSAAYGQVDWSSAANGRMKCGRIAAHSRRLDQMTVKHEHCHNDRTPMCEFDCSLPFLCPKEHPFAVENGAKCCKYYNKVDDTSIDAACDGSDSQIHDPGVCCPDSVDCQYGECINHPAGKGQ